jgi:hypothetical protein
MVAAGVGFEHARIHREPLALESPIAMAEQTTRSKT